MYKIKTKLNIGYDINILSCPTCTGYPYYKKSISFTILKIYLGLFNRKFYFDEFP